jgi:membrane protease YdiL (CAAX protease family)
MPAILRRILLAAPLRLVWTGVLALVLVKLMAWIAPSIMGLSNITLGGSVRNAVMTVLVFTLSLWLFEGKRPRDAGLALQRAVPDTLYGFLLGAALLTAIIGILAVTGSYRIVGWATLPEGTSRALLLGRVLLAFLAVGIFEEVATRGIVFRLLEQSIGTWLAIVASALFFGFGHRNNPGATWVSSVAIAIEAGGLLAAAYVATRSLWLPIGLHWAWNLFEGPVWGSLVSGNDVGVLARATFPGPALMTGGAFGPEAGLPAIVLGAALGVAFLVIAVRREQIFTPGWMRWIAARARPASPPVAAPSETPSAPAVSPPAISS